MLELLILVLLFAWFLFAIKKSFEVKKSGGCSHDCSVCAARCQNSETEQK